MRTRYTELGYRKDGPNLWRICATDDGSAVGPHYRTKAELLADLERFAAEFGCEDAQAAALEAQELIETLLKALHGALESPCHRIRRRIREAIITAEDAGYSVYPEADKHQAKGQEVDA